MKKKGFISFIVFLACVTCSAQNLVPNGSFEKYKKIPLDHIRYLDEYLKEWGSSTEGSPDFFHELSRGKTSIPVQKLEFSYTDSGLQVAKDGKAFVGLVYGISDVGLLLFTEYIQVKLHDSLKMYHRYRFDSYFNLADISNYKNLQFGFILSKDRDTSYSDENTPKRTLYRQEITNYTVLDESRNINSTDWTSLNHLFRSKGGEVWLTIGSFDYTKVYSDLHRTDVQYSQGTKGFAYYFIDDVSLVEIPCLVGPDTVCVGEEVELYSSFYGASCRWYSDLDRSALLSTDTFLRIIPQESRWYYLETSAGTDSLYLTAIKRPRPTQIPDTFLCVGDSIDVSIVDISPNFHYSINWSDSSNQSTKTIVEEGKYFFTIHNGFCATSDSFEVSNSPLPAKMKPSIYEFCKLENNDITINGEPEYVYFWDDLGSFMQPRTFSEAGIYTFKAETTDGCSLLDSLEVIDKCPPIVLLPNAFVVDGINNVYRPYLRYTDYCSLTIYNRWGERIFFDEGVRPSWDGKVGGEVQSQGVYFYEIITQSSEGENYYHGTFHMLRKQ